mmetsp:Transcript_15970/g.23955  ORF Transcript_15970/g.23955 Transcript_15970/m.23955 type:complete len:210 (+) Transcript_15970:588-1217(+)
MAIVTGLSFSVFIFIARAASRECPNAPIIFAASLGSLMSFIGVALFAAITSTSIVTTDSPLFFLAIILDGLVVGSVVIAFSIAPRYVSGAQLGLISLIEIVLGPLYILIFFSQYPPFFTLIGGILILLTLFVHEYLSLISYSSTTPTANKPGGEESEDKNYQVPTTTAQQNGIFDDVEDGKFCKSTRTILLQDGNEKKEEVTLVSSPIK